MRLKKQISTFLALQLVVSPAWAVKHIKDGAFPNHKQDMIHHPSKSQVQKFGSMQAAIIGSHTGPKKAAVILAQFPASSCGGCTSGNHSITNLAAIDTYFTKMAAYFNEVSYGKMTLSFGFFGVNTPPGTPLGSASAVSAGVYTLSQRMEYYGCGDEGLGCAGVATPGSGINAKGDYLIADALSRAIGLTSGPTTTHFDAVIVVHAGNGNETTLGTYGDIWSIFYSQDTVIASAGAGFEEGDVVPATEASGITSPLGVMCHEFGHELGLPDLYNTASAGGTSVAGNWELMDSGPFNGNGADPSHMGAWDKLTLGWATAQTVTQLSTISLPYVETAAGGNNALAKITLTNGLPQEYFLVEYRSRSSGAMFDQSIPGDGLLVWHVDEGLTSTRGIDVSDVSLQNTVNALIGTSHYGVSIITADGVNISNANQGDGGNAFTNGQILTTPQSNNFAGEPSGAGILDIKGVGSTQALVTVFVASVTASTNFLSGPNPASYPNPAGKGYMHPNPGGSGSSDGATTIQFQLSRPAKDYSINIYTLSGDLVRKIPQGDIHKDCYGRRSPENCVADYKFVYEYDWDLKNGNGAHVAPGVYLFLVRADGETRRGKIVIIR